MMTTLQDFYEPLSNNNSTVLGFAFGALVAVCLGLMVYTFEHKDYGRKPGLQRPFWIRISLPPVLVLLGAFSVMSIFALVHNNTVVTKAKEAKNMEKAVTIIENAQQDYYGRAGHYAKTMAELRKSSPVFDAYINAQKDDAENTCPYKFSFKAVDDAVAAAVMRDCDDDRLTTHLIMPR